MCVGKNNEKKHHKTAYVSIGRQLPTYTKNKFCYGSKALFVVLKMCIRSCKIDGSLVYSFNTLSSQYVLILPFIYFQCSPAIELEWKRKYK